jgi:hypothetical protein
MKSSPVVDDIFVDILQRFKEDEALKRNFHQQKVALINTPEYSGVILQYDSGHLFIGVNHVEEGPLVKLYKPNGPA